jgi:heme/copper-type cytochrome/quinol oxidase subunit 4
LTFKFQKMRPPIPIFAIGLFLGAVITALAWPTLLFSAKVARTLIFITLLTWVQVCLLAVYFIFREKFRYTRERMAEFNLLICAFVILQCVISVVWLLWKQDQINAMLPPNVETIFSVILHERSLFILLYLPALLFLFKRVRESRKATIAICLLIPIGGFATEIFIPILSNLKDLFS